MKSRLPIFACLVAAAIARSAVAQVPAAIGTAAGPKRPPAAASDSISGDALLRRVLTAVEAQPSIAAKLRYKIDLKGRGSFGSGIYLQQGRGAARQFRLELNLQVAGAESHSWQICDGSILWLVEDVPGKQSLAQVDVLRLRRARPKSQSGPLADGWLALGGLPKLLSGIDGAFCFGAVREGRLDELRVWTLRGQWEPSRLAALLPDQKGAIESGRAADLGKLSPQLPDAVVVHVGCDDFFPYRIEYWRTGGGNLGDGGALLVVMELYEVRLGGPIEPAQFAYRPPDNVKPADRTVEFLDRLGLEDPAPAGANQKSSTRR